MIPRLVAKLKEFERRKAAKALIARRLLTFVWRRRIRKLKELKRKEQEQARRPLYSPTVVTRRSVSGDG